MKTLYDSGKWGNPEILRGFHSDNPIIFGSETESEKGSICMWRAPAITIRLAIATHGLDVLI